MCGLVGCYPMRKFSEIFEGLSAIKYRGPDAMSLHASDTGTIGHNRLSIIDVASGHQPMFEKSKLIVLNGEIYNYRKLRGEMHSTMKTDSDTEVVLKLYCIHGFDCVKMLDGMFAFAIADKDGLFLARDPLGIKPLYFAFDNEGIWFASEIKSLLGKVTDIQEFPPGHWWHSLHGMNRYYSIDDIPVAINPSDTIQTADILLSIQEILRKAVHKRLISDAEVPVGVSLSGGLDSSIVAALACENKPDLNTFVVGTSGSEDIEASKFVADYLGTHHHEYKYTFDEVLAALPEIIYHLESYDAPLVRSAIPNYFLAKLSSDYVKVILLGEGADELFAGYEYMSEINNHVQLEEEMRVITKNLHNTNLQRADRMTMAHGIEGRVPFLDLEVIKTAFSLPASWKLQSEGKPEKELLRRSVEDLLPKQIVWRPKKKYSDGAGSMGMLTEHTSNSISDLELQRHNKTTGVPFVRSKEELFYYQIFKGIFGDSISIDAIGTTRSVTKDELK